MIKTINGGFQIGIAGWDNGASDKNFPIETSGEWQPLDFTFTTGANPASSPVMFLNNWHCTGTKAFIDNWEMYEVPSITTDIDRVEKMIRNVFVSNNQIIAEFEKANPDIHIEIDSVVAGFDEFVIEGSACNPPAAIWLAYPEGTKGKAGPAAFLRLQLASNSPAVSDAFWEIRGFPCTPHGVVGGSGSSNPLDLSIRRAPADSRKSRKRRASSFRPAIRPGGWPSSRSRRCGR